MLNDHGYLFIRGKKQIFRCIICDVMSILEALVYILACYSRKLTGDGHIPPTGGHATVLLLSLVTLIVSEVSLFYYYYFFLLRQVKMSVPCSRSHAKNPIGTRPVAQQHFHTLDVSCVPE